MTSSRVRRIARVRPLSPATPDEQFFVANDAVDFASEAGRTWTLVDSPLPGSLANGSSADRPGWHTGAEVLSQDPVH
ncbi:hypothetical protein [Arthrobacter sp. AZCC_0090]|uniref:hypothetical protein n=1 Tax=Arthrobacter sp. AZCC_0090 TaxID=2735881 RepID=UPI0017FA073C|nr:hypothetical protein [Arthrobacter sp. AZCC_0090]MBB6404091.1 hypothetical protein [Arthrobacter sp. AZCC_0090]